ncbi:hypothetical protein SGQ83_12950 [Flavobacterium sp. Fl-318]|jgi:hypothetical protein|uniref:Uncharacterized protein n=1 Tax=Flavobacterium cupriresistens TaxID=2893885 RepID=A0ABU4RI77_9FLAO|nr:MULTISPECIES: hypothetical protein [unclassified Flavobacterium]MDX6190261.1 hypothetical protein [Flavobacterium sp. Fl-318]UFH43079.1 hypothetical protein LNP23_02400 [Flavobacterium sp. F-323]
MFSTSKANSLRAVVTIPKDGIDPHLMNYKTNLDEVNQIVRSDCLQSLGLYF